MDRLQEWIRPSGFKPAPPVVLVPGIWMPAVAMTVLARRLEAQHLSPQIFSYRGRDPLGRNVQALARFLGSIDQPVQLVAHSLGGLLVLQTLNAHPYLKVSGAVLLAAPVLGSLCGRKLAARAAGRWLLGATEPLWLERKETIWASAAPLGVIAGTVPWGLGRMLGPLPVPNDGVVCLKETPVEGMTERCIVRMNHSGMLFSREVAKQVIAFLRWGRFNPA